MNKSEMSYFKTNLWPILDAYQLFWGAVGSVIAFVWKVEPFIMLVIWLIVADLILGIIAARKRKEAITSKAIWRTVEKILVAAITILATEGVHYVLLDDISYRSYNLTWVVVFVIAMSELRSIYQKTEMVLGVKIWESIKQYIQKK